MLKLKTSHLILGFLFCSLGILKAQETTVLATNPASIRWYQIKTPGFRIIYNKSFENEAQRMANTMELIREPEAKSMGKLPRRIPIILQNYSSISNGFVTMGPWRSEFYAMPPQDYNFVGGLDWLNMLASHEYRHMVQFQHSMRGFNKLLRIAFGQEAAAAMAFASAPQWFWEGDAVATETAFTSSGRGRLPNFDLQFRTNLLEDRTFNYNKQYLRSYKHFIPNHYVLGYEMISFLRKETGNPEIWSDISKRTWNFPIWPYAFSSAVKKESGMSLPRLYKRMATDLRDKYMEQVNSLQLTDFEVVSVRDNKSYTNYIYPQALEDGSIAVLKSGIGDIDQIVILKDGEQVQKFVTGPLNETGFLSTSRGKVVWNEYRFDPRWSNRNYTIIKGLEVESKLPHKVSSKSRYAGASISYDGKKVLTVQTDESYKTNLVLLDYYSGKVEKVFENPENAFYSMARITNKDQSIISLKTTQSQKSIVLIDIATGSEQTLKTTSSEILGHPILINGYLLYNSPYSGIDNIYALEISSGKEYQVTSAKYGAYNPCISNDGKTLYYNNQSRDGIDVVSTSFDPGTWRLKSEVPTATFNTYQHLVDQEGSQNLFTNIPDKEYSKSRYSKLLHAVNIHSWGGYVNSDLTRANLGITSKDILGTTQIKAGYEFDIQERTGQWKANATFQAWYPVLDVSYIYGGRVVDLGPIQIDKSIINAVTYRELNLTLPLKIGWIEENVESGIRLPFNFTRSKFYSSLTLSNYYGLTKVSEFENSIDGGGRLLPANRPQYFLEGYLDDGLLRYNSFNLSYYSLLRQSTRDINSKWGLLFNLKSKSTPYGGDFEAQNLSMSTYLFLPGLVKHHSLWGYWSYQSSSIKLGRVTSRSEYIDNYIFRNEIPLPRGISDYIFRSERMYSMSANYTLPIWYPDIAIGPLVNFKRVRFNAFMDYAFGDNPARRALIMSIPANQRPQINTQFSFLSTGAELKFDVNLMRFLPELDFGIRYSYGLQPSVTKFEVLIGTFNF